MLICNVISILFSYKLLIEKRAKARSGLEKFLVSNCDIPEKMTSGASQTPFSFFLFFEKKALHLNFLNRLNRFKILHKQSLVYI